MITIIRTGQLSRTIWRPPRLFENGFADPLINAPQPPRTLGEGLTEEIDLFCGNRYTSDYPLS